MDVVHDMKPTWIMCMSLSDVSAGATLDTEKNKKKLTMLATDVT